MDLIDIPDKTLNNANKSPLTKLLNSGGPETTVQGNEYSGGGGGIRTLYTQKPVIYNILNHVALGLER